MPAWDAFSGMELFRRELDRAVSDFRTERRPGTWREAFLPGRGARRIDGSVA